MLIKTFCGNGMYWIKLVLGATISLLVLNSLTILDEYEIITAPMPPGNKPQARITPQIKWIVVDDTDISIEEHEELLDNQDGWSAIVMDTANSRQTLRCNNCKVGGAMDGVIQAVKHGAQFIYYSDNALTLKDELPNLKLTQLFYGLEFFGNASAFNIESHFKDTNSMTALSQNLNSHYRLGGWRTPPIQTFIAEEMLLNPGESPEILDRRAAPIILPKDYLHPFAQKGSLYFYDAFWALAPIDQKYYTVWSMMTEKLLEEMASEVGFNAPRRSRSQLGMERMDRKKIDGIALALKQWMCVPGVPFFKCVDALCDHMTAVGHFPVEVSGSVKTFISELTKTGYKEPFRVLPTLPRPYVAPINRIIYWPEHQTDSSAKTMNEAMAPMCAGGVNTCKEVGRPANVKIPKYDNIMLVVVFNRPGHYGVVDFLERMYRPFFPRMIYCGHDMNNFFSVYNLLNKKMSFIEVDFNLGQYGYECVQKAIQMKFDVDGYIHLSDDVLLNVWNIAELPKDRIWFQKNMRIAHLIHATVTDIWKHPHWGPWTTPYGRPAAKATIAALINLSLLEKRAKDFMFMLSSNVGGLDRVYYEASDIFYVPKRFAEGFVYFSSVFDAAHVHLEIAVPTILNGLDLNENIVTMNGSYLWYQDRGLYQSSYNYKDMFMHSVKLGPCIADPTCQKFLCNRYLSCLYSS